MLKDNKISSYIKFVILMIIIGCFLYIFFSSFFNTDVTDTLLKEHKENLGTIIMEKEIIKVSNFSNSNKKIIHHINKKNELKKEYIYSYYIHYEIDNTLEKAYIMIEGKKYEPLENYRQESEERKKTYFGVDYFDTPNIKIILPEELYVKFDL